MIPPRSACESEQEWLECCRLNFAAAALQGLLARDYPAIMNDGKEAKKSSQFAEVSYEFADAMLAERDK